MRSSTGAEQRKRERERERERPRFSTHPNNFTLCILAPTYSSSCPARHFRQHSASKKLQSSHSQGYACVVAGDLQHRQKSEKKAVTPADSRGAPSCESSCAAMLPARAPHGALRASSR
eukprot:scaffold561_cov254-Pinguiococcus_pyrenoidosus.AAC.6